MPERAADVAEGVVRHVTDLAERQVRLPTVLSYGPVTTRVHRHAPARNPR
jgi:hypothetical protein